MNNKLIIYKKIISFLIIALIFFGFSKNVEAALVSIKVSENTLVGSRIFVDVLVDPENQSINSIESTINFPTENLIFNGFSVKQSSIPIWVEEPKEKNKGQIYFSGVVPGGLERIYDPVHPENKSIPVLRLFFIAKTKGSVIISSSNSTVLQNDGKGTATNTKDSSVSFEIKKVKEIDENYSFSEDKTPPNPFYINFFERSVFGKTPRVVSFIAEDNEGGIEHYEVGVGNLGFHTATSPFSLPYRLFPYTLTVRAFDFSGNVREQQIIVPGESPYGLGVILVLALIIFGILRYSYTKRKKV